MKPKAHRRIALGFGLCAAAAAMLAFAPVAEAQFFWSPFFQEQQPRKAKPRRTAPKPPSDDLAPIAVPKESSAPPPPDDRPYDPKLLRLAEILGAVHYLRELCGAQEGQIWREQMTNILKYEGSTAVRRAKLVNSFNDGYRGYRRTYRSCTSSATLAIARFSTEGAQIAEALAKPSGYASRTPVAEAPAAEGATATDANADGAAKKEADKENANKPAEPSANASEPKGKKSRRSKQAAKRKTHGQAAQQPD